MPSHAGNSLFRSGGGGRSSRGLFYSFHLSLTAHMSTATPSLFDRDTFNRRHTNTTLRQIRSGLRFQRFVFELLASVLAFSILNAFYGIRLAYDSSFRSYVVVVFLLLLFCWFVSYTRAWPRCFYNRLPNCQVFTTALFAVDRTSCTVSLAATKYKTTKNNSRK